MKRLVMILLILASEWPSARPPLLFETNRPGVFAVGDVRAGSVKRVAAAVGKGSVYVQFVHNVLAELPAPVRAPTARPEPEVRQARRPKPVSMRFEIMIRTSAAPP
jgi:hypothetical protein